MKAINLIAYSSGRVIKTVQAESIEKAKDILEYKGFDCQNDYFLEEATETTKHFQNATKFAKIRRVMENNDYGITK